MSGLAPGPDRCPRCGSAFRCGAAGPGPCACATVTLGAALQAQLRESFKNCLCLDCLRRLAQDADTAAAPAAAAAAAPAATAGTANLPAAGP